MILLLATSTVPVPLGTRLIFVFVPPAVNVKAPVPVIEPVAVPVPPLVTGRAVVKEREPAVIEELNVAAPVTPKPP